MHVIYGLIFGICGLAIVNISGGKNRTVRYVVPFLITLLALATYKGWEQTFPPNSNFVIPQTNFYLAMNGPEDTPISFWIRQFLTAFSGLLPAFFFDIKKYLLGS